MRARRLLTCIILAVLGGVRPAAAQDALIAKQAEHNYSEYRQRVAEYVEDLNNRCQRAHEMRSYATKRLSQLNQAVQSETAEEKQSREAEAHWLRRWLAAEQSIDERAEENVEYCQRWLAHTRDEANVAAYNAAEEEQRVRDQQAKVEQARAEMAWQEQLTRAHQYYEERNRDAWGPAVAYGGRRRGGGFHYGGHPIRVRTGGRCHR